MRIRDFFRSGHSGTLFTALLYFDFCFAVWVLNGAMAPFISEDFGLSNMQKGWLMSIPVLAGALMRLPLGILAQYIGRKNAAQLNMAVLVVGLLAGYFLVHSFGGVMALGVVLGLAGASFGVALSLGAGWFPPQHKGLAMGIAGAGNSGAVLAVLFAPPLAKAYGWQTVYGIAAIPLLITMGLLHVFAKEPPDGEERKSVGEYLTILFDADCWVFNVLYMVTFGGFVGLTSFLPTLFHEQYGIPRDEVGKYSAGIVVMASILRVVGGAFADRVGGIRAIYGLSAAIAVTTMLAATLPSNPWVMVAILIVCFSAMGAGNGAVFQLVPLRFKNRTALASSMIGEIGGLAGGLVPVAMSFGREQVGSFAPGFLLGTGLSAAGLLFLMLMSPRWIGVWISAGGKAKPAVELSLSGAAAVPVRSAEPQGAAE